MGFKLRYIKKYMSFFLDFLRDVNQKTVFFCIFTSGKA
jgi:hypothetical protein